MSRKRRAAGDDAVGAAEFKTRCLELIDRVRETREEYVVTKHGKPVAKLVPYDAPGAAKSFFGSMSGTVLRYELPFAPIPADWLQESRRKGKA